MLKKTKFSKLKNHFPICVFSLGLVFFIFLTMSVNVKAANTYTLPYNVVDYQDNNSSFLEYVPNIYSAISDAPIHTTNFDSLNSFVIVEEVRSSSVVFLVFSDFYIEDTSSISSIYYNSVRVRANSTKSCIRVSCDNNNGVLSNFQVSGYLNSGNYIDIFGSYSPSSDYGVNYQRFYPFLSTSQFFDVNNNLVIDVHTDWVPEDPEFDTIDSFLDFTNTVGTNIDNSLSDLENQKGFFDSLIGTIKNAFGSLKGWLSNGFGNLSSNIKNFFGPFLRNIQDYLSFIKGNFDDLTDKFSHFFEIINSIYNLALEDGEFSLSKLISVLLVPSQEDISSAFSGTVFYTLYTGVNNCSKYLYTYVTTLFSSSPNTFVMTLPTFTFGGKEFRGLQISFDWFIPYKTYFDIIVSGFLIMGYIRFLAMWINNFFHGSGFIDHDVNNISARSDSL